MKMTYEIAHAASWDEANHSMRKAGRNTWNRADYNAFVKEFNRLYPEELQIRDAKHISELWWLKKAV